MTMDPMSLTIGFVLAWVIVFPLSEWRARRRKGGREGPPTEARGRRRP
jgi:hypothetical protein